MNSKWFYNWKLAIQLSRSPCTGISVVASLLRHRMEMHLLSGRWNRVENVCVFFLLSNWYHFAVTRKSTPHAIIIEKMNLILFYRFSSLAFVYLQYSFVRMASRIVKIVVESNQSLLLMGNTTYRKINVKCIGKKVESKYISAAVLPQYFPLRLLPVVRYWSAVHNINAWKLCRPFVRRFWNLYNSYI